MIELMELYVVKLPLVAPFETSFSVQHERDAMLVRVVVDGVEGWGECVAMAAPWYSSEYLVGCAEVIRTWIAPALRASDHLVPEAVGEILEPIVGHRMSKAAVEMAVLDAHLRALEVSFAAYLGVTRTRVPSGVSVGIQSSLERLVEVVGDYLEQGYGRIKLKIKPGWDLEPVRAVREAFGPDVPLQVDANSAFRLSDAPLLRRLDEFGLLLIEQPLYEDDLRLHAELAKSMTTPICLDESIVSARAAADAIAFGACSVINIKPGRVGGYLEARRIHDIARANGIAVWCGGMLETGVGRQANIALAGMPGFTLTGDVSASDRFYRQDITEPVELVDGHVLVSTQTGVSGTPIPELLEAVTVSRELLFG